MNENLIEDNNIIEEDEKINTQKQNEIIINTQKLSFLLDNENKYDIYQPLELDDDVEEEPDFNVITKNDGYDNYLSEIIIDEENYNKKIERYTNYPFFRDKIFINQVPNISTESTIISHKQLKEIHCNLPYYNQYKDFTMLYQMNKDGTRFKTLYDKCEDKSDCIMIIKNEQNEIFGAYLSEKINLQNKTFYGTAESFLFTFYDTNRIRVFQGTKNNYNYIYTTMDKIGFGCSDEHFGLEIHDDFNLCFTSPTNTYDNPSLSKFQNFKVVNCEVLTVALI